MKKYLHVGCGASNQSRLLNIFPEAEWQEVRLDIDPSVKPDIVASMTDMSVVETQSFDALFSSHNLEHLYPHEVAVALSEFYRVLNVGGMAIIRVPNIQDVAEEVAKGNLEGVLYESPAGPIAAIDILYGHRRSMAAGNLFMAHKTAFVPRSLGEAMVSVGFIDVTVRKGNNLFEIEALGKKK